MCKALRFNGIDYPMLQNPKIKIKSNEVAISNVTIDFEGKSIADLPFKFQEVQIVNNPGVNETIEAIAYVEGHRLPTFRTGLEPLLLTLTLMAPRVMASKRTTTNIYESVTLQDLCNDIVSSLVADGFVVNFNNLSQETLVTRTFINSSIEKTLNSLAKEYNFVWYIDDKKNIYFRDSATIFTQPVYSNWSELDQGYIHELTPKIRSNDYANVINLKNASLITDEEVFSGNTNGNGERFTLDFPIWLNPIAVQKVFGNNADVLGVVRIVVIVGGLPVVYTVAYQSGNFVYSLGLSNYNDDPTKDVCLIFDANDSDVIVGIQFNINYGAFNIVNVSTDVAINSKVYRFFDVRQIEETANYTNTTGVIEKTISLNRRRLSRREMFTTAKGNILQFNNEVGLVNVTLKNEIDAPYLSYINGIGLFTRFKIDLPDILTVGDFVVTAIEKSQTQTTLTVRLTMENKNFNETFLDIYRKEEIEEKLSQVDENIVSILVKDEDLKEQSEIYVNGVNVNAIT